MSSRGFMKQGVSKRLGEKEKTFFFRLVRLLILISIPPFWLEIAILHFRGSFQNRWMWAPLFSLPVIAIGGTASLLEKDEQRSRIVFRPFTQALALIGSVGTFFHLRGIGRQMGGFANWKYNITTGPPFPAPMQLGLLGLLGFAASAPSKRARKEHLVQQIHAFNFISYLLLAIEAGYNHWAGGLYNRFMFVPLILSPLLMGVHALRWSGGRGGRMIDGLLSTVAAAGGLVGFGFHLYNIFHQPGGLYRKPDERLNWNSLFYGAPVVAPLQLSMQGLLGLLAFWFGGKR